MAGQDSRRLDRLKPGQGLEAQRRRDVRESRHHLGVAISRQRVERAELVTDEQRLVILEVDRAMSGRMAGGRDDPRMAGNVEHVAVRERLGAVHLRRLGSASADHLSDEPVRGGPPSVGQQLADRIAVSRLALPGAQGRLVRGVNQDPSPGCLEDRRDARVVGIAVGENHGVHVARRVPERGQIRLQPAHEPRQPGVERRQTAAVLDQIPVDERAAERVNSGEDVRLGIDGEILFPPSAEDTAPVAPRYGVDLLSVEALGGQRVDDAGHARDVAHRGGHRRAVEV